MMLVFIVYRHEIDTHQSDGVPMLGLSFNIQPIGSVFVKSKRLSMA